MSNYKNVILIVFLFLGTLLHGQAPVPVFENGNIYFQTDTNTEYQLSINGEDKTLSVVDGKAIWDFKPSKGGSLYLLKQGEGPMGMYHISQSGNAPVRIRHIPLWLSIVPPLVAILLALLLKEVIISLFMGIWAGSFIAGGLRFSSIFYWIESFLRVVEKYVIEALTDAGHMSVIIFSLLIGGMVALISKNGGMAGVVDRLSKYARSPRSTQFITWFLGVAIFFDDYANTLIVGNTMRSVTDRYRISREKLAYIVDSTAAPVAAIAFITTWIGAELGYIGDGISSVPLLQNETAYSIFLASLKYSYYPILTLAFILMIVMMKKDFGPMHKAEVRARTTGQVSSARNEQEDEPDMEDLTPVAGAPHNWLDAVIPVAAVILMTILGLLSTGMETLYGELYPQGGGSHAWGHLWSELPRLFPEGESSFIAKLGKVIGSADSYVALLWASLSGVILAILITLSKKIMNVTDTMHWLVTGFKTMMPALIILTLAWSLAITTEQLHTAEYLSKLLQGNINPYLLPVIVFILSAFISFSTGSSWSTMAILYPIAIPTTYAVCTAAGMEASLVIELILCVISTVLSASVLGDHCSPISDTTILSSLASDCNHLDHVRTQFPYAITVGIVSMIALTISILLGGNFYINILIYIIAFGVLYLIIKFVGKDTETA